MTKRHQKAENLNPYLPGPLDSSSRILAHLETATPSNETSGPSRNSKIFDPSLVVQSSSKEQPRTQTPVPSGLLDFPPLAAPQSRPTQNRAVSLAHTTFGIKPVVPIIPAPAARVVNAAKEGQSAQETSESQPTSVPKDKAPEPAEPAKQPTSADKLPAEDAKVEPSQASTDVQKDSPTNTGPSLSAVASRKAGKSSEKRQPPAKIDIAAAKGAIKMDSSKSRGASKPLKPAESSTASLDTTTPNTGAIRPQTLAETAEKESSASGDRVARSRTAKAIPAPKVESASKITSASPTTAESLNKVNKPVSRRPSLASIHAPNTPISEKISDNASLTSTSMSRANSPPPSKVGSAPIRQVSKSQQKKERQVRAKQAEDAAKIETQPVKPIVEEPEIAPIIGRKKKTKKNHNTADSTPTVTRPTSPVQVDGTIEEKQESRPATPVREQKDEMKKGTPKAEPPREPESPPTPDVPSAQSDQNKTSLTAASIVSSLQKDGQLMANTQDLFKGVPGLNHRYETPSGPQAQGPNDFPRLGATERALLDQGIPVVVEKSDKRCTVVLPDRATLSNLSKEQAQRYVALHRSIMLTPEQGFFNPSRQESNREKMHPPTNLSMPADDGHNLGNRFGSPAVAETAPAGHSSIPGMFPTDDRNGNLRPDMVMEDAERAFIAQKKETEMIEKRLNGLLRKNRRMMFGGH